MDLKIAKNREDEYFARQEFERRQKIAEEQAAHMKKKELEELKKLHWMRCPKDGMEMVEMEYHGVRVDKCTHCGGLYLDAGELEQLFEANEKKAGTITKILRVFS